MFTDDIVGGTQGGNGVHEDRTVRVFSEGIPSNETEAEAKTRRSVGGEEDGPSRQIARYIQETARRYVPAMKVLLIARRDRYLRGGDISPSTSRASPPSASPSRTKTTTISIRTFGRKTASSMATCRSSMISPYIANVARVNAAALGFPCAGPRRAAERRACHAAPDLGHRFGVEGKRRTGHCGYEIVWRETTAATWAAPLCRRRYKAHCCWTVQRQLHFRRSRR